MANKIIKFNNLDLIMHCFYVQIIPYIFIGFLNLSGINGHYYDSVRFSVAVMCLLRFV